MNKLFKNPSVLVTSISNAVMILGGLIGWFTVSASLQAADLATGSTLENNLNSKKTVTIVVGVLSLLVTLLIAKKNRRWLAILPLLLNAFVLFATYNQLSGKTEAESLGITYTAGYWLALVGALGATLGCLGMIATVRKNKA